MLSEILRGWKQIANYLGVSVSWIRDPRRSSDLFDRNIAAWRRRRCGARMAVADADKLKEWYILYLKSVY
jgi:hypothetical protein